MKSFFTILIVLVVMGYAAMLMGIFGAIVYVLGVAAAIIALLIALYDRQQRIEEKLDKLLAVRKDREEGSVEEDNLVCEEELLICEAPEDGE